MMTSWDAAYRDIEECQQERIMGTEDMADNKGLRRKRKQRIMIGRGIIIDGERNVAIMTRQEDVWIFYRVYPVYDRRITGMRRRWIIRDTEEMREDEWKELRIQG